jgi:hypothetical protein
MFRFILTIARMGVAVALALAWTLLMPAHAHDYKRPDAPPPCRTSCSIQLF